MLLTAGGRVEVVDERQSPDTGGGAPGGHRPPRPSSGEHGRPAALLRVEVVAAVGPTVQRYLTGDVELPGRRD